MELHTDTGVAAFLADARDTVIPGRTGRHGPLPALLISMTLVTGLVDAFSYLVLGHVFVANMTGNVVFLGFALAGALLGAVLIRHAQAYDPLVIALATIVAGAAASRLLGRSDPAWFRPQ